MENDPYIVPKIMKCSFKMDPENGVGTITIDDMPEHTYKFITRPIDNFMFLLNTWVSGMRLNMTHENFCLVVSHINQYFDVLRLESPKEGEMEAFGELNLAKLMEKHGYEGQNQMS